MSLNVKYEHKLQDIAFLGGHHIQYIPHLHRELELICLLEGDVIAYADSVRYELHAGDIFLTFPNQIHSYEKVSISSGRRSGLKIKPTCVSSVTFS